MRRFHLSRVVLVFSVAALCIAYPAAAQQPFVTDNADVTDKGKFHFQFANEFDRFQLSSLPNTHQDVTSITLAYGVAKNLELSVVGQFLGLSSTSDPRLVRGLGDTTFSVKYNFRQEAKGSRLPAFSASAFVQLPTGNARNGLGSGVTDYGLNAIAQKSLGEKNTLRVNAGYLFAGNTLVGNIGISSVRGHIFTGGASFVRKVNDKWQLGAELTGAVTNKLQLSKGQLQTQFGGNYQLNKKTTLDFGFILGRFAASPRYGLLFGFSRDF